MEETTSKKDRLEHIAKMEESKNGSFKIKGAIIAIVAVVFLGFFIFAITSAKKKSTEPVTLTSSGWVKGNTESTVTFTEFGDFQCPACLSFEPTMQQLAKEYDKRIKIVFKHFPLSGHKNAMPAAIAAEAAGKQNKFWEFHDVLYAKQSEWDILPDPTSKFASYAKTLKLDVEQFKKDIKDKKIKAAVTAQSDEGIKVGVNGTPSLFINGEPIEIPGNYEALKAQIDSALVGTESSPSAAVSPVK